MSAPGESRPSICANPRPAATSTVNSSRWKGKRRTPSTTLANIIPAPKRPWIRFGNEERPPRHCSYSPHALLNATATTPAHSSHLVTQPATNPPNQIVTPEEEQQHQAIGE